MSKIRLTTNFSLLQGRGEGTEDRSGGKRKKTKEEEEHNILFTYPREKWKKKYWERGEKKEEDKN